MGDITKIWVSFSGHSVVIDVVCTVASAAVSNKFNYVVVNHYPFVNRQCLRHSTHNKKAIKLLLLLELFAH